MTRPLDLSQTSKPTVEKTVRQSPNTGPRLSHASVCRLAFRYSCTACRNTAISHLNCPVKLTQIAEVADHIALGVVQKWGIHGIPQNGPSWMVKHEVLNHFFFAAVKPSFPTFLRAKPEGSHSIDSRSALVSGVKRWNKTRAQHLNLLILVQQVLCILRQQACGQPGGKMICETQAKRWCWSFK